MSEQISRNNYTSIIQTRNAAGLATGERFRETRPRLRFRSAQGLRRGVPNDTDNWSRIAWRGLGDGRHWWIIADLSGVVDPLSELQSRKRVSYVSSLTSNLLAGSTTFAEVSHPGKIRKGDVLTITNVANGNEVTITVARVDTGKIHFSATTVPAIVASTSRIVRVSEERTQLLVPGTQEALLRALAFDNPFNTLEV